MNYVITINNTTPSTSPADKLLREKIGLNGEPYEYGVDFDVTYNGGNALDACINNQGEMSQCITIPVGQDIMYLDIEAFYDNNNENFEDLQIIINAITGLCQQAELAVSEINFNLYDQIPIIVEGEPAVIECFGDEATLEPTLISGGYIGDTNDYTYEWYDQNGNQIGTEASLVVSTSADAEYQLIVYDMMCAFSCLSTSNTYTVSLAFMIISWSFLNFVLRMVLLGQKLYTFFKAT